MPQFHPIRTSDTGELALSELPGDLAYYHAHEWNRYTINAPTELDAARIAAALGWWLHCWEYEPSDHYSITDHDPPTPWSSWEAFANRPIRPRGTRA